MARAKIIPKIHREVAKLRGEILGGVMLVVDPASISLGYALYIEGKLEKSGTILLPAKSGISYRLFELFHLIYDFPQLDLLVVERIRGRRAARELWWSVGVVVAASYVPAIIEMPIPTWKAFAGKGHVKTDENDALAIGDCIVALAKKE